jgi:enoyl-CoA hydratase/carnithine racemase
VRPIEAVVAAHATLIAQEREFLRAARAYNTDIAEYGMAWMLPRLVGHAHALDLLLSARLIDAAEAERIGLVNRVFPADNFLNDVRAYAAELATNVSPRSMAVIKQQVYDAMFQSLEEATVASEHAMIASLQSDDFKEGVAHFLEKRAPNFTGQ